MLCCAALTNSDGLPRPPPFLRGRARRAQVAQAGPEARALYARPAVECLHGLPCPAPVPAGSPAMHSHVLSLVIQSRQSYGASR